MALYQHNRKTERNDEIKALWHKGGLTQWQIGLRYGLTQTRINAIIYDRKPGYHYCVYPIPDSWNKRCNARAAYGALCNDHRTARAEERIARLEARERAVRDRARNREQRRYEASQEALAAQEARAAKRYLMQVLLSLSRDLRDLRKSERPTAIPRAFKWQGQGRERVRYAVRHRDKHTCQDCGMVRTPEEVAEHNKKFPRNMKSLDVHHILGMCGKKSKGYDSAKDMDKLITLCHKCHFGRHDFNQESKKRMGKRNLPPRHAQQTN